MAKFNPEIKIKFETRLCTVKGKKAFFHRWADISKVIETSVLRGGHSGGTVRHTVGIIEYTEDGTVHECYPYEIRFLDTTEKAKVWNWGDEIKESEADNEQS